MDTQSMFHFFTRPERSLFGVCSRLAKKLNVPPVGVRVGFIVLTLMTIPLGIIAYAGFYLATVRNGYRTVTLGALGALLGIPFSYYFQSDIVKNYGRGSGMFSYLKNFTNMVDEYDRHLGNGWDIVFNVCIGVVVFALIGGAIGYYLDRNRGKK